MARYRILALDGGGAWALIQVKALIALHGNDAGITGHDVLARFDMVAANSGGSLVLGGLLANQTLGELLALFMDEQRRRRIFSPTRNWLYRLAARTAVVPRYNADAKLDALYATLGDAGDDTLPIAARKARSAGQEPLHLLIVSFDCNRHRATFFRSRTIGDQHGSLGQGDTTSVTLAEAIHASTNAPVVYFDAPARLPSLGNQQFWDGGVTGCNNPVLAGVAEAICLGQRPEDIIALSIGTGTVARPDADIGPSPCHWVVPDIRAMATAILDDPPDMASFLAHLMTGQGVGVPPEAQSRIIRMNPQISPKPDPHGGWHPPAGMTWRAFNRLAALDVDAVRQSEVDAIRDYTEAWIAGDAPNQPIRKDGGTLKCELGHTTFAAAARGWQSLDQ